MVGTRSWLLGEWTGWLGLDYQRGAAVPAQASERVEMRTTRPASEALVQLA